MSVSVVSADSETKPRELLQRHGQHPYSLISSVDQNLRDTYRPQSHAYNWQRGSLTLKMELLRHALKAYGKGLKYVVIVSLHLRASIPFSSRRW